MSVIPLCWYPWQSCFLAETLQVGFSWQPCVKMGKDCAASKILTEMPSMVAGKVLMEMPSVCGSSSTAHVGMGVLSRVGGIMREGGLLSTGRGAGNGVCLRRAG